MLILLALIASPSPIATSTHPAVPRSVQVGSDIPAKWQEPRAGYDYTKRDVMIPMRDGV